MNSFTIEGQSLEPYIFILTEWGVIKGLQDKSWDPLYEKSLERQKELEMIFLELNSQPENKLLVLKSLDSELLEIFSIHLAKQILNETSIPGRRLH